MPPLPWATDAQTEFLLARIPEYKDAQKTELRLRNSAYNKFWTSLYEAWEIAFPERLDVFPTKSSTEDLSKEEIETLSDAFKTRREQLKTWFRWRTTQKARSRKTVKSKDLVQALSKPGRSLQPAEMYSKLHYKTEIRPQVNAMIKDQGIVDRAGKLNIIKKVTREKFLAGGDDVKVEVESKLADIAKAKAKQNENTFDRKPQQYLDAIQDCPALLGQFLDILAEKTGWAFTVLMGGPDPQSNGDISVASYHVGETQLGNQFGTVHPNFEKVYMEPFTEFLVNLFPENIRHSRLLCLVHDDLLSIDGSNSESQHDIRSGKEESEEVVELCGSSVNADSERPSSPLSTTLGSSFDADSELPLSPSPSLPLSAAPTSSFDTSEFYFPHMSSNFLNSELPDAAPNVSLSQVQLSVGTALSGQPSSVANGSFTTANAPASFQPFFNYSNTAASAPFSTTFLNVEDDASSTWNFPDLWGPDPEAWTFPTESTTPFTVSNALSPTFVHPDASIVPFAVAPASSEVMLQVRADAPPSIFNASSSVPLYPDASCVPFTVFPPNASTNPFTVFAPLQEALGITSQVSDASPGIMTLSDASTASFTAFTPLQVSYEAIVPLSDASTPAPTVSVPPQQSPSIVASASAPNESCAVPTPIPTPAVNHKRDIPLSLGTNSPNRKEATVNEAQDQPLNAVPSRRSTRAVVPSTRADVMNSIGTISSRAARVDKENAPVILDQQPTWLLDARGFLETCELGKEWSQCVTAWAEFEDRIAETRTTKGALPSMDLRPEEWTKWTMKGKFGVQPYHLIPDIVSPLEFGTQVLKWWHGMQPTFCQGTHKFPMQLSKSTPPDDIESEWAPLRKGGPNGLMSVLTLLAWWGKLAPTSTQWEDSTFDNWKTVVLDVTETIQAISGVLVSRLGKREISSSIERVCKRARTK